MAGSAAANVVLKNNGIVLTQAVTSTVAHTVGGVYATRIANLSFVVTLAIGDQLSVDIVQNAAPTNDTKGSFYIWKY